MRRRTPNILPAALILLAGPFEVGATETEVATLIARGLCIADQGRTALAVVSTHVVCDRFDDQRHRFAAVLMLAQRHLFRSKERPKRIERSQSILRQPLQLLLDRFVLELHHL